MWQKIFEFLGKGDESAGKIAFIWIIFSIFVFGFTGSMLYHLLYKAV